MAKFIPYTFTKKDVISDFKNDKQYENWIAGQVRSKKIVKVRNGLYVHVDVSGYPLTTKFELARISFEKQQLFSSCYATMI